jgi:hypothetical protein
MVGCAVAFAGAAFFEAVLLGTGFFVGLVAISLSFDRYKPE